MPEVGRQREEKCPGERGRNVGKTDNESQYCQFQYGSDQTKGRGNAEKVWRPQPLGGKGVLADHLLWGDRGQIAR